MKDKKGLIFAIEEFSSFDGPGIRTTVFLKGCPLKCSWCHNPEGQSFSPQVVKSPNGCINCGSCVKEALRTTGKPALTRDCVKVCPRNLIRVSGTEYTPEELRDILIKNCRFYESTGGGVTFSGGEPLAQPEFLYNSLLLLENKINRYIQTSGYCENTVFSEILNHTDGVLFDLKVMEPQLSLRYTGADITVILKNFETLIKSGKEFVVRIPLIPSITDTKENVREITDILNFYGITYAEALPYNKMAGAKYLMCDREYKPDFDPQKTVYLPVTDFFDKGITLKIL